MKINKREEKEGVLFLPINTIKGPYKTFSNQKSYVSLVVRHIMFNLHSGVGNSVLCQKKGGGSSDFYTPEFQMLWHVPRPVLFVPKLAKS